MSGFVYVWKDRKRNKCYVGSHWGNCDDGYICSSDSMREAYRRRPQDFRRRIVACITTNRQDLLDEEQRWLDMIKPQEFGVKYYNINGNVGTFYWWANEETRKQVCKKLRVSRKGKTPNKGNHHSEEAKLKMSIAQLGNLPWTTGMPRTTEDKHKISLALKNKPWTKARREAQENRKKETI